jgi:transcriptional regulator with XRE-family HTH domain
MPRFGSRPDLERRRKGHAKLVQIHCRECGAQITRIRVSVATNRSAWCLSCLATHPEATLGQRLKCHRLSAGLTIRELARRSGVQRTVLGAYENDRRNLTQRTLDKLIRSLSTTRERRFTGVSIRCRKCRSVIVTMRMNSNNNGPVFCVRCLPRGATFAQRLKAHRLSADMTLRALAERCGVVWQTVGAYEQSRMKPSSRTLAKLIHVLGGL